MKMQYKKTIDLVKELDKFLNKNNLSQSALSIATGVNQPVISRYLSTPPKRLTSNLKNLCCYAKINLYLDKEIKPEKSLLLMNALKRKWDGSAKHEAQIAKLILAIPSN